MNILYLNDLNSQEVDLYLHTSDNPNPIKYPSILVPTNPDVKIK